MVRQYLSTSFSRERNRIHARKTRQRKKEQMQNLQTRADELKAEQIRLKQTINEKATASILLGLFSKDSKSEACEDPKVEKLLRRSVEEIPDASKLPELPALILPGQHNSKKHKASELIATKDELPNDGIDYNLLGKDRSKCTPAELDQIRRERNRMHAKRTRDRKRLFMEEMADMCNTLEEENALLQRHLDGLNGIKSSDKDSETTTPTLSAQPSSSKHLPPLRPKEKASGNGVTYGQIKTLLEAAGSFPSASAASAVSASTSGSDGGSLSDHDDSFDSKRRRLNGASDVSSAITTSSVPQAITTQAPAVAGC